MSDAKIMIPRKDSILDTVRERPAMYMGVKSLTALFYFLQGYEMGRWRLGEQDESSWEVPRRFADWVAYRLHLDSNWSGFWHRAILSRVRDEALAFDRFYELRDEFGQREPKVVATIREDCREYPLRRLEKNGGWSDYAEQFPKSLRVVVYTDDPGFFLESDPDDSSFFFRGWFLCALDAFLMCRIINRFDVKDENIWLRLLDENKKYRKNLEQRRARIRRKEGNTSVANRP